MSPADIVNIALDQIGAKASIQSVSPPLPANRLEAQVAARNYQTVVDAVFRSAHWNCARKQVALTLLRAGVGTPANPDGTKPLPPVPWLYSYALPPDCLKLRFVMPDPIGAWSGVPPMTFMTQGRGRSLDATMPFVPALDVDAQSNDIPVILTNAENAVVVYTKRLDNPDLWDASLRNAIIATLAAWFVNPIARSKDLLAERVQVARALIEAARISDGNEGITSTDNIPDWFAARDDCLTGFSPRSACIAGYDMIALPGGITF